MGVWFVSDLLELVLPGMAPPGARASETSGMPAPDPSRLTVAPAPSRPALAPEGLPSCYSAAVYEGSMRESILAYKERGQRRLAAPLGDALAEVVQAGLGVRSWSGLVLVPVPATAAARRARHGDHMLRLARRAAARLRGNGWRPLVSAPLRARPKVDSARLDRAARARAARGAFAVRPVRLRGLRAVATSGTAVVLLDDVLTTGATLAAVARHLTEQDVPVAFAATLAATRLRKQVRDSARIVPARG